VRGSVTECADTSVGSDVVDRSCKITNILLY
jgi:hypothetical protein